LRRIFEPKGKNGIGGYEKLYEQKLRDFYSASSRSIIRVIKYREMGWTECGTSNEWVRNACAIIVRKEHKVQYRDVY